MPNASHRPTPAAFADELLAAIDPALLSAWGDKMTMPTIRYAAAAVFDRHTSPRAPRAFAETFAGDVVDHAAFIIGEVERRHDRLGGFYRIAAALRRTAVVLHAKYFPEQRT